jgi:hypothetical protein
MTVKVFISYRREDTKWQARAIYRFLTERLPREHVFMDVDSIPPGADFVDTLECWVGRCNVLLVLIGPNWVDAVDSKTGQRRLENPNDFVRIEVRKGLVRGIPVVPVLIDGAQIPRAEELPYDLRSLLRRNAEFVELRTVESDIERLMQRLGLMCKRDQPVRETSGTLIVTRSGGVYASGEIFWLFVDGKEIGAIEKKSTKQFNLPAGRIVLQAVAGRAKSEPLEVEIVPGTQTLVEIRPGWIRLILAKVGQLQSE